MEKLPQFERPEPRVVGKVPEEKKKEFAREIRGRFGEKHYLQFPKEGEKLKAIEYEKRPYEKEFIAKANEITDKLLSQFGLQPFDVPEQNFHIVPHKYFNEAVGNKLGAATSLKQQSCFIDAEELRNKPIDAAIAILHETIHLKGYTAFQVKEGGDYGYRSGLVVISTYKKDERGGPYENFDGLEEAIVEALSKKYFSSMLLTDDETVKNDVSRLNLDSTKEKIREFAAKDQIPADEIYWIDEKGKVAHGHGYRPQREVLNLIADEIYKDNKDRFVSRDEVMDLFFKAHFTGNIVELGKLAEQSFGEGSFREIGSMDDDNKSGWRMLEILKRKRRISKKK